MVEIDSEIHLFADDCVYYHQINSIEDTVKLQSKWAWKWDMRFQRTKCNMMQLTRKRVKRVIATYTLGETVLENVDGIEYLSATITT